MRRASAALAFFAALVVSGAAKGIEAPADPWPRQFKSGSATILVYQPQVESWAGNVITFRSAIAITKGNPKDDVFGAIWAKARTQVDKVSRIVALEDLALSRRSFPTLADNGLLYLFSLRTQLGPSQRTVSLDRLEASLAAAGPMKPQGVPVDNDPPQIIVSDSPAILVSIDGPPTLRPVPDTGFQRVINTRALILAAEGASTYYLRVHGGWLFANAIAGPWDRPTALPENLDAAAKRIAATGVVDLLEATNGDPKPSLESIVPAVHVTETPAELVLFEEDPAFTPVAGTGLARASNTASDVFLDVGENQYFVLLSGRWFRAATLAGPWVFVPSPDLPSDFRKIPASSPASVVLAAVAGTPQAEKALIANSIPQTATVKRVGGPTFAPRFDGGPQLLAVAGTSLQYVVNSPTPILQVNSSDYYALKAGIWFTASALTGPWIVAASVPEAIYAIPPSSPLHYVTYVQIFGATLGFIYEGYTPGYLGTVATPEGVVVYGTGYPYAPWIGSAWYPAPATYGVAAQPTGNPADGMAFGFAMGGATAAANPYHSAPFYRWYGAPYETTSANIYGYYGDAVIAGARTYFSTASETTADGSAEPQTSYTNPRTGQRSPYGWAKVGNDLYADKDGQMYSNASGEWRQPSPNGWSNASSDTSWADRESRARGAGADRFASFSQGTGRSGRDDCRDDRYGESGGSSR